MQCAIVNETCSQWSYVISGIPHSKVLRLVLFIICVYDLPEIIESMTQICADDMNIYRKITTENDSLNFKMIWIYYKNGRTSACYNASKCKVRRLGGSTQSLFMQGEQSVRVHVGIEQKITIYNDCQRYRYRYRNRGNGIC